MNKIRDELNHFFLSGRFCQRQSMGMHVSGLSVFSSSLVVEMLFVSLVLRVMMLHDVHLHCPGSLNFGRNVNKPVLLATAGVRISYP